MIVGGERAVLLVSVAGMGGGGGEVELLAAESAASLAAARVTLKERISGSPERPEKIVESDLTLEERGCCELAFLSIKFGHESE